MPILHSAILGLIQGLTEFLPISSSGHLVIIPWLLGWQKHSLVFDIILHSATLLAIIIYFRKEWTDILHGGFSSMRGGNIKGSEQKRLFWNLVIASIPAIVIGLIIVDKVDNYFRNPEIIAITLGIFGLILYFTELYSKKNRSLADITWQVSLIIGLLQMSAFIPGVSRSGITISVAMAFGMNRESSVRFSFLLGAPLFLAATCYSIREVILQNVGPGGLADVYKFLPWHTITAGFIASFLSSILAIHFLLNYIRKRPFTIFVIYRLLLSVIIIGVLFWRG